MDYNKNAEIIKNYLDIREIEVDYWCIRKLSIFWTLKQNQGLYGDWCSFFDKWSGEGRTMKLNDERAPMTVQTNRGDMNQLHRIKRAETREAVRNEWFSLYLLDDQKKTPAVRSRMRALHSQFMAVR